MQTFGPALKNSVPIYTCPCGWQGDDLIVDSGFRNQTFVYKCPGCRSAWCGKATGLSRFQERFKSGK